MIDWMPAEAGERDTEDPAHPATNGRFELYECSPVELKDKQVQVQLWALRMRPAGGCGRDPAPATVPA